MNKPVTALTFSMNYFCMSFYHILESSLNDWDLKCMNWKRKKYFCGRMTIGNHGHSVLLTEYLNMTDGPEIIITVIKMFSY